MFFGTLLGQHTMHVQEEVAVASPGSLPEAVASLCGTMRLPYRCPPPQWVPSVLGARLERVRIVRTARGLADDNGVTPALRIGDATSLFRDASAGAQAQRWLLRAHEARAKDARGGGVRAPHRVRLALECVVGSASVLWAMSLPMGAAYTGPSQADGAHVLAFPRSPPLVVRPSRGGGWTAAPRLTLGVGGAAVTPRTSGATSSTVLEAALRGMLDMPGMGGGEGRVFWEAVLASPSSEARRAFASAVAADATAADHASAAAVWDCALGAGAWARRPEGTGAAAMLGALEATAGLALVRPAHHDALLPGCGFAVRGADSRMALRCTWDDRGTTHFEWMGAATADVACTPRRRGWDITLTAGGVAVWRSDDATAVGAADALATAVGTEAVDRPWPTTLYVRWAARADGRSVDITLGAQSGSPLHIQLAPQF